MTDQTRYCEAPECERPIALGTSATFCALHLKRHQRGVSLTLPIPEGMTLRERFFAAALAYADADSEHDGEFVDARRALVVAAKRWLRSEGWTAPAPVLKLEEPAPEELAPRVDALLGLGEPA